MYTLNGGCGGSRSWTEACNVTGPDGQCGRHVLGRPTPCKRVHLLLGKSTTEDGAFFTLVLVSHVSLKELTPRTAGVIPLYFAGMPPQVWVLPRYPCSHKLITLTLRSNLSCWPAHRPNPSAGFKDVVRFDIATAWSVALKQRRPSRKSHGPGVLLPRRRERYTGRLKRLGKRCRTISRRSV